MSVSVAVKSGLRDTGDAFDADQVRFGNVIDAGKRIGLPGARRSRIARRRLYAGSSVASRMSMSSDR